MCVTYVPALRYLFKGIERRKLTMCMPLLLYFEVIMKLWAPGALHFPAPAADLRGSAPWEPQGARRLACALVVHGGSPGVKPRPLPTPYCERDYLLLKFRVIYSFVSKRGETGTGFSIRFLQVLTVPSSYVEVHLLSANRRGDGREG